MIKITRRLKVNNFESTDYEVYTKEEFQKMVRNTNIGTSVIQVIGELVTMVMWLSVYSVTFTVQASKWCFRMVGNGLKKLLN